MCHSTATHTHEFAGSEMIASRIPHNHRFAGVTSEAIPRRKSHIHAIYTNDDFYFNHHHEIRVKTGPAIKVGRGKHIHLVEGRTTTDFNHHHDFIFTTFIANPLQEKYL
ncbi:MAG: YmaF family protein [Syntrophomonas sp.]|nr:YmaF family protein [Syntrophomonas sp.]